MGVLSTPYRTHPVGKKASGTYGNRSLTNFLGLRPRGTQKGAGMAARPESAVGPKAVNLR
jgi:hypothetical protein